MVFAFLSKKIKEKTMLSNLSQSILKYKENGKGIKNIYDRILLIVYYFPKKLTLWNEDVNGEFLISFLPAYPC